MDAGSRAYNAAHFCFMELQNVTFDTPPSICPPTGVFFGSLNHNFECPDAERPEENTISDNPPLPQHIDDENGDGHRRFDQPNCRRGEERAEEVDHDNGRNVRIPSPEFQQFPPQDFEMDWRRHGAIQNPVYYPLFNAEPYAFPFVCPYAYSYALLSAFPYANPFPFAYAPPYVLPYAYPFVFANVPPYAHPYAYPFAYVPPYPAPYVPCYAAPQAFPYADPHGVLEQLIARNQQGRPEQDPGLDAFGVDEEDGIEPPELEVFGLGYPETIGPLTTEETFGFFGGDNSLDDDAVVPSTSGLSPSTRRSREESNEEQASAKRPRCVIGATQSSSLMLYRG